MCVIFSLLSPGLILPSLRGSVECSTQHAAITRAARPRCVDTPGFWKNAMLVSKAVGEDGLLAAAPSMGKEGLLEMSPSIGKEGLLDAAPSTGKEGLQTVAGKEGLQTVAVCVILGCWLLGAVRLLCAYLNKAPASTAARVVFGAIAASGLLLFPAWRKANELFRRRAQERIKTAPSTPRPVQHLRAYQVPVQHPCPSILHRSDSAAIPG